MPITLTTPKQITAQVDKYRINSFALDNDNIKIHIGYQELDAFGNVVAIKAITINPPESLAAISAVQAEYDAIKLALYSAMQSVLGDSGTVS